MPTESDTPRVAARSSSLYYVRYLVLLIGICILTAGVGYISRASSGPTVAADKNTHAAVTPTSNAFDTIEATCQLPVNANLSFQLTLKKGKAKLITQGSVNKQILYKDNALYVWLPGSTTVTAYTNKQQTELAQDLMNEVTNNNTDIATSLQTTLSQVMMDPNQSFAKYCQKQTTIADTLFTLPTGAQVVQK